MKSFRYCCSLLFIAIFLCVSNVHANRVEDYFEFSEPLDLLMLQNGIMMPFDVGIGSGACHFSEDADDVIYTVTDRGANIKNTDSAKLLGVDLSDKEGKIFPIPNFSPTIYKLKISTGKAEILAKIQLKTEAGVPVTGLVNPGTEAAWDVQGNPMPHDPSGIDAEGIVRMQDGSFWISEEYGPSILHVAKDGRIIERWVPKGVKATLAGAGYPIKEKLPAILRSRPLNRGIESISTSPDGNYLYFAMQSPLANPDREAYKNSRWVRVFKIDNQAGEVIGEYVYEIDTPDTFMMDNRKKSRKQKDVKVSELTAVGVDKLVVLERISKTSRFYQIDLNEGDNILGTRWDKKETFPTLEQSYDPGVKILPKSLLLDTDDLGGLMKKVEGLAWLGGDRWIMVNDNDFGIEGEPTCIATVRMSVK